MGCGGSKEDSQLSPGGANNIDKDVDAMTVTGPDKARTFRERRLSMSQQQDANARPRRLSIYGQTGDELGQPSIVTSPCSTCGCKTPAAHASKNKPAGSCCSSAPPARM